MKRLLLCLVPAVLAFGQAPPKKLVAELKNAEGVRVGMATLTPMNDGVRVDIEILKLAPGMRAAHIHETGKCEAPAFQSAGGHFNPDKHEHGQLNPKGAHVGDLGNLIVLPNGTAKYSAFATGVKLGPGEGSLLKDGGTSIVIHEGIDDLKSDPAGNAGKRIACGVVTR
ncbi:MAG: superoxide dismutase family protein [Bryobacteraceae bacterium]|nr:superoxide dismutase family protein [Bryobacteraceae bacterium]